jgi:hypothetical protein
MELLGIGGILFWLGLLMFSGGFALVWVALARHDGLDRSRTLHVIFDEDSPMRRPEHRRDRAIFRVGIFVAGFGAVNVFTAVSMGDARERAVCNRTCQREGYLGGRFAPSTSEKVQGTNQPQRACWCVGPAGSVELPAARLPPLPGAPPAASPAASP